MQTISPSQVSAEVPINENFAGLAHVEIYAKNPATTTGLTWGYWGGRYGGTVVAAGTLTLPASQTSYLVANRSTGAISQSTTNTNWLDGAGYARIYLLTTGASTVTAVEDHRAGPNGVHGPAPALSGATLGAVNVWSKNQSIAAVSITSSTAPTLDASLSNNFKLTLAHTPAVLANPTNSTDGMVINIRIKQDATGTRLLTFGSAYTWAGGVVPTLSTAANAVDQISCYYDSTDSKWMCAMQKGFA